MIDAFKAPTSPFEPPTLAYRIVSSPLKCLVQQIYAVQLLLRGSRPSRPPGKESIAILCISDTHCHKPATLPAADLLIHAGDLTNEGTVAEIQEQIDWLKSLEYRYKVVIAGNHDSYFDPRSRKSVDKAAQIDWGMPEDGLRYLQHSTTLLSFPNKGGRELRIYGAPQIPACGGADFAFQYTRGQDAWSSTIPSDTDVLVTHTPPKCHLDLPRGMGCEWLLREIWRIRPRLHVFGHVHCGYGQEIAYWDYAQNVYEGLIKKRERGILGDLIAIWSWIDTAKLLVSSVLGILWSRVWGGSGETTLMVNSALMVGSTGELRDTSQLVYI